MGTFFPIQTAFDAGELSPRYSGQLDSPAYKRGLAHSENWEHLTEGPIRKRGGLQHIALLMSGGSRLIPFTTKAGATFLVELGNLELRTYDLTGRIAFVPEGGGGATSMVVNGGFDTDTGWNKNHATISGGRCKLTVWRWLDTEASPPEYVTEDATVSQTIAVAAPGNYSVTWDDGGGAATLYAQIYYPGVPGGVITLMSPGVVALPGGGNVTITMVGSGVYGEYAYVDNVALTAAGDPAGYAVVTPWSVDQLPAVQYVMETSQDRMIFVHPNKAPWFLKRNADGTWASGNIVFTGVPDGKPSEWAAANWPGVIEIFAGRLYLAATPAQPNQLWASRAGGDILDFRRYTDTTAPPGVPSAGPLGGAISITDDCALDLKVATRGQIRWLKSQRNLLMGTDLGESYIMADGGVITPAARRVVPGSDFGSAPTQAIPVGDQVLYVSTDRRRPRVMGFEFQSDGWVTRDLAFLSQHLTIGKIDEIHFAKSPYPAFVFVMGDDTARIVAYDRAAQVLIWWRFTTPLGSIRSAAVSNTDNGSLIWFSVAADDGSVNLEVFRLDDAGLYPMDGYVSRTVAANAITGLAHLNGPVQYIIDGSLYTGVVAAGVLPVEALDGTVVIVGRGFNAYGKTLPPEGGNPAGTMQAHQRRFVEVHVRLNDSALPLINGRRPPERSLGDLLDDPTSRITGDVMVKNVEGWKDRAVVTLEQDLPFRTEICALFGPLKVNL